MTGRINNYVKQLHEISRRIPVTPLQAPVDNTQFQQRLWEQLREEEDFYYSSGDSGVQRKPTQTPPPVAREYKLWEFVAPIGTSLNNVNILFDSSIAVEAIWGDGSVQLLNTGTKYNHTFN